MAKMFKIFARKPEPVTRAAARYTCQIECTLTILEPHLAYEGRLLDFSSGGAMFRPRLAYLLDRKDVPVCLSIGDMELFGRIMGTSPLGFGLRFDEPLSEAETKRLIAFDEGGHASLNIEAPIHV
jgi:hypothetical protein